MAKIFRDLLILLAIFGGIVIAYVFLKREFPEVLSFDMDSGDSWEILSKENEESLGEILVEEVLRGGVLVEDPYVDSSMQEIYDRLLLHSELEDTNLTFYVLRNPTINAATFPGGNIVVFSGLIEFCERPEELAAVIAHEMGHVYHEHVTEKLTREIGLNVLLTVLTGGDPTIIHEISAAALSSVFSRKQEGEADDYALSLLVKCGIHPEAIADLFEHMNDEKLSYPEALEWFMSHPHNDSRIHKSRTYKLPRGFKEMEFELDWPRLQDSV